jgi:thioesterase domain-containing protein
LVSWADGEVLPWRDLVENLDWGWPVFGLRAPGVDRVTRPLASVEELAAYYVEQIRAVQPHGPYRLGGFCFSGLVAYEMARVLREEGEELDLLALIDAYPYRAPRRNPQLDRAQTRLREFKDADLRGKGGWVLQRVAALPGKGRYAAYETIGPRLYGLIESHGLQHLIPRRPLNLVFVASNLARRRYVPKPADVRIEFFRAQTVPDSRPTPWASLAGRGVNLRQITGPEINHERMIQGPHIRLLATELERALEEAANGRSGAVRSGFLDHPVRIDVQRR